MNQTNSFLKSPFEDIAAQGVQDDDALLPGQKPVKDAPQVEVQKAPASQQSAEPAPAAEPKPAKTTNWLPPADQLPIFEAAAKHFNVPVNVLMALGNQESGYRANAIGVQTKWGRAKGIMQYLDGTAQGLGINPFDPAEAIPAAAKQLRERLDAGASMKDAVMEHFAGPDRAQWGAKTAAYGDEVMAKVDRIGQAYAGGAAQPAAVADAKPDPTALQQQLDAEEPGRYKVLPEGYAETHFSAASIPRDAYEQTFRSVNPGASQSAIDYAMSQYDAQAKARAAQPAPTPAEDRFKALTATPEAQFDARLNQRLQGQPNGVVPPLPAKLQPEQAPPPPAYDEAKANDESALSAAASYLGKSFKSGMYDMAGAGAKVLDEINPWTLSPSDAAVLFKDDPAKLKQFQDDSAVMILSRFAKRMTKNSEESMQEISDRAKRDYGSMEYATTDTGKAAYMSPTRVIGDAIRSLPTTVAIAISVYLTRGAAARAEQTALAAGMTQEAAQQAAIAAGSKAMATAGAVSEGITGYAQQANQSAADAEKVPMAELAKSPKFQQLLQKGFTPEAARAKIIADTGEEAGRMAGIVDSAVNHVGGEFLGKILTEGGKLIPRIMKGAANESATEFVQSAGEQFGQNKATRDNINPNQSLTQGVGEAAVAGAAVGGVMGGGMAGAGGKGHSGQTAPAAAPAQAAPAPVVAAGMAPVSQGSTEPGPLSRSIENASEQHAGQENRVTATAPTGEQVSGQMEAYQEDADGNFVARIVADDGTVAMLDSRTGVQLAPEETPDAGPLTASLTSAAEQHADYSDVPVLTDIIEHGNKNADGVPDIPTLTDVIQQGDKAPANLPDIPTLTEVIPDPTQAEPPAPPKPTPTIQDMTDDELKARLKYIANQTKESGRDKRFVEARKEVEREINKRAKAAPATGANNATPANDGGRSNLAAVPDGTADSGGSGTDRPLPRHGSADAGVDGKQAATDTAAASGATDAKPALKEWERNPYQAYTAGDQATAEAYMAKVKADPAKFEVKQTGKVRWQVVPISEATGATAETTGVPEQTTGAAPAADLKSVSGRKLGNGWTAFKTSTGTLDIPRAKMPQVKSEHRSALTNFLNARGITHEQVEVPAGDLKPTQREFSAEKVAAAKDNAGGERSILISSDNHVLDGHHQWLAQMGSDEPVKAIRLNAPIRELLPQVHEFPSSMVEGGATKAAEKVPEVAPRQARPGLPKSVSAGPMTFTPKGIDKVLYRETNADGLDGLLRYHNSGSVSQAFFSDNDDLAIGQGNNTGVKVQFRAGSVSGREHLKPLTGDIAGREYRADFIGPDAIDKITLPKDAKLRGISKRVLAEHFDKTMLPDGKVQYLRKGVFQSEESAKSEQQAARVDTGATERGSASVPAATKKKTQRKQISISDIKPGDKFNSVEYGNTAATGGTIEKVGRGKIEFGGLYMGHIPQSGIKLDRAALVGGQIERDGVVYDVVNEAPAANNSEESSTSEVAAIFEDMGKEGRAGSRARTKAKKHPLAKQISEVESSFLDMLGKLDDAGLIAINC